MRAYVCVGCSSQNSPEGKLGILEGPWKFPEGFPGSLVFGGAYSPVNDMDSVFMNVQYIGAYFLHLMHSFLLAMFVALLIKRTGIGVVVFLFYGWIEPLAEAFIRYYFEWPTIANMLPSAATKVLITNPFMKYGLARSYTSVQPEHLTIAAGWMLLLLFVNYKLVTKRDL